MTMHARYAYGNPYAPMGSGAYSVEVFPDGRVELLHDKHGAKRGWKARALPALWAQLAKGIESSGFPRSSSPTSAPPGTQSFDFAMFDENGVATEVSGPNPAYRDVSLLFSHIVGQMSKDQIFGFEPPIETPYVTDVTEA